MDLEKARVFQTICDSRQITRKELAALIGSRPTTISNVVHQLIRDRLVVEGAVRRPGKQGRPEVYLHPNFHRLVAASLSVVSREIKAALVGLDGEVIASTAVVLSPAAGNDEIVEAIVALIGELSDATPRGARLLGAGVSLTGSVNTAEKRWMYTARWRNLYDIDLTVIEGKIGLPLLPDRLINTRLDYLLLSNPGLRSGGTLLFHWGFGIGATFAIDGRIVRSPLGSFAEVGHWKVIDEGGRPCPCGGQGCLETVASVWALSPSLRERYGRVPEEEEAFAEFYRLHALERDAEVAGALDHVARSLANLFMTLYPDRILVYGPFVPSPDVVASLADRVKLSLPPMLRDRIDLTLLPLRFDGDMFGGTHRLFREAMAELLTVDVPH